METVLRLEEHQAKRNTIGDILLAAGRLEKVSIQKILSYQQQHSVAFGEAALALNLVGQADILFALSKQFDFHYLTEGESAVDASIIAAYQPHSDKAEALRRVRSQLLLRWLATDSVDKKLAIYAETAGTGCSWVTANLAVVFSQLGESTVIVDCDLRKPVQHQLFGCDNKRGLSGILSGAYGIEVAQPVTDLHNLHVVTSGPIPPNPQELLSHSSFGTLLNTLSEQFDVVLIDTPDNTFGDAQLVLVHTGQAMIVCRQHHNMMAATRLQIEQLQALGVDVVGSILSRY